MGAVAVGVGVLVFGCSCSAGGSAGGSHDRFRFCCVWVLLVVETGVKSVKQGMIYV